MLNGKTAVATVAIIALLLGTGFGDELEDNWGRFLHFTTIARFDLAKGYAQAVLDSNPDPVALLGLVRANPEGYQIMLKVNESAPDAELAALAGKIIELVNQGRFTRRSDDAIVAAEVRRLNSGTARGWLTAVQRLQDAGEYAIPWMLDALADESRESEWTNIIRALPKIGKDAIRPYAAALQTDKAEIKGEIIKAMGEIGYPQSLPYLKYIVEKDESAEMRALAGASIDKINPVAAKIPAARLFYTLGEQYYYHAESLTPQEDADTANVWFWNADGGSLVSQKVDRSYFYELMAMRCCEWALRADPTLGNAIALWVASFFKAESAGVEMPQYFGTTHADALVYATTAGVEYLHEALARAIKDQNAYVALGVVEALATTAGERSLWYTVGPVQPLAQALSFKSRAVRYSAAIAIASAGPKEPFAEHKLVVGNLAEAIAQPAQDAGADESGLWNAEVGNAYALRAVKVMFKLAEERNAVLDLSLAQDALMGATNGSNAQMQMLAGQTLAYLDSPNAQRAIAAMALNPVVSLEVRISGFESLANSAKVNGNMLVDQLIDAIYALISSEEQDADLRGAAAAAYGALNLPSMKVKDLILDQSKS